MSIPVSVFDSKDDNRPMQYRLSWNDLAQRLCRYEERSDKNGRAWSPVTYRPGTTRGKANVEAVHALVLDVDHALPPWTLLERYEYVGHTTHSHTPENPRWRITLPLSRAVNGTDWPGFWLRAQAFFGSCVDPAAKDSSRIYFLPSCPPGAQHEVRQQHGEFLDPDSLPQVPQYEPPPRATTQPRVLSRYLADWAMRFAIAKIDMVALQVKPGRNDACNRAAYTLAGLVTDRAHEIRPEWITEQLLEACERNGLVADDGEVSVRNTIHSGLKSGLARPWSPADQEEQQPVPRRPWTQVRPEPQRRAQGLELGVKHMDGVKPELVDWLWRNRFARGKATLLMGDPGLGKSLISHWAAAVVSVGGEWPDEGRCEAGAAILFTIEDSLSDTVAPRLIAAGADRSKILAVTGVIDVDTTTMDERMFALEEHISLLEELIEREGALLVVLDPISAYLGANVNAHKETDVRRVLAPLQQMAERTGVALLLLMHLTKGSGVSALYRATGSIAFPAVCRVVLGVAIDPNDSEKKRRLLLPIKFNIAPDAVGIGYRIHTTQEMILPHADERDQPPILVWDNDPVLVDATTALDRGNVTELGALAQVKRALVQIVIDQPIPAIEGFRQLKEAGVSTTPNTVGRAREELGIESKKDGRGGWYWHPPKITSLARGDTSRSLRSLRYSTSSEAHIYVDMGDQGTQDLQQDRTGNGHGPSQDVKDLTDRKNIGDTRAHAREAGESKEVRYCALCMEHLEPWLYDAHLPCRGQRCPVHAKYFDEHECDAV